MALTSSALASAPPIMLVRPTPKTSRNSVTGTISGRPGRPIAVEAHAGKLTGANALDFVSRYDIVADGTDTFDARYLLNDACHFARRTLVSAALLRFDGQLSTFKSWAGPPNPCYR